MKENIIPISGSGLTLGDIERVTKDISTKVEITSNSLRKIRKNHEFLRKNLNTEILYGINTGFGPMATHVLGTSQLLDLQKNLIRSHAVGMGEPISQRFILASMVVRLNTLAKGYSGVSEGLLSQLCKLINHRIIPIVPSHGAVGTSGDLVQLAHIALALLGEGSVLYENRQVSTTAVFKKLGIKPYVLQPKEGLALINGTSVMSGIGALLSKDAGKLISFSIQLGSLALELTNAYSDSIAEELHVVRPHQGQAMVAGKLRNILRNSKLLKNRNHHHKTLKMEEGIQELPEAVQEVYSLRCIPQIVGPIFETWEKTEEVLGIEINSVTDNPILDDIHGLFLHGGNFHGDYVAAHIDQLKAGITKLTMLSERRINYFLNRNINKRFPPFLNLKQPGLTLGLQGLQFVATSTTAHSQSLSFPHHIHSIPTNGDNQDIVSMGTDATLIASQVIENAFIVLTIELVNLMQAVDCLNISEKLSKTNKELYYQARGILPKVVEDRSLSAELTQLQHFIQNNLALTKL